VDARIHYVLHSTYDRRVIEWWAVSAYSAGGALSFAFAEAIRLSDERTKVIGEGGPSDPRLSQHIFSKRYYSAWIGGLVLRLVAAACLGPIFGPFGFSEPLPAVLVGFSIASGGGKAIKSILTRSEPDRRDAWQSSRLPIIEREEA
jgi:hypothetical protein